jgi:hypothetical protein
MYVLPAATSSTACRPPTYKYCDMMPESLKGSLLGNGFVNTFLCHPPTYTKVSQ